MTEPRAAAARSARRVDAAPLLAAWQRLVLWYCGQLVLLLFSRLALPWAAWSPLGAGVYLATTIGALFTIAAVAIAGYRVAVATGSDVGWLWGLALLVPLLNLPAFVLLGRAATRAGRAAGLPFGLLGLPKRRTTDAPPGR